jgi:Spy/CpxP family protein refolding chaperone
MKNAIPSRRALALLGLAVLLAVPAAGHPVRQRTFRMQEREVQEPGRRARLAESLDLTQEQRDRIQDLRRDARREAVLRRGEMASLRSRIQAEFLKQDVDALAVRSLGEELGKLAAEAVEARLGDRLAFLDVLTPEQRETLQGLREGRGGNSWQRGPGHRGHGRRGMHGGWGVPAPGDGPDGSETEGF